MDLLLGYCWKSYLESHNIQLATPQPAPHLLNVNGSTSELKASWGAEPSACTPTGVGVPIAPTTMVHSAIGHEHLMPLPPPPSALPYLFPLPDAISTYTHPDGLLESSAHLAAATNSILSQVYSTKATNPPVMTGNNTNNTRVRRKGSTSDFGSHHKKPPQCASVESGFDSGESSPSTSEDSSSHYCGFPLPRFPQSNHLTIPTGKQIMLVRSIDTGGRVTLPTRNHHGTNGVGERFQQSADANFKSFYAFLPVHSLQHALPDESPPIAEEGEGSQDPESDSMPVLEEEPPLCDSSVWRCERIPNEETPTTTILFPAIELETIPQNDNKPQAKNTSTNGPTEQRESKFAGGGEEEETRRLQLPCRWGACRRRFEDNNELYDHVLKDHLEPLRPPNATAKGDEAVATAAEDENASPVRKLSRCRTGTPRREGKTRALERFKCRWKGCEHSLKRSSNPMRQFDWLINHYTTRHAHRAQPYKCLLAECSLRFRLRRSLIDHLSSAHDRKNGAKRDSNQLQTIRQEARQTHSCYSFRPCNRFSDHSTSDVIDQRTMEFVRDTLAKRHSPNEPSNREFSDAACAQIEKAKMRKLSTLRPRMPAAQKTKVEENGCCRVERMPALAAADYIRGIFKPPVLKREA